MQDYKKYGSRRFILALFTAIGTTLLVWFAKISPEVYQVTMLGIVGIYVTGNTTEKIANKNEVTQ